MIGVNVDQEIANLVEGLAEFHGYRSIWMTLHGRLCHAEPDDELEVYGYTLVATLMRPDADTVREQLRRVHAPRMPSASVLSRTRTVDVFPGFAHA